VHELQLRQTQLSVDSLGTDIVVERRRGGRSRNGRAGKRDVLLGKLTVLGVAGNRDHVVRSRQFFRKKDRNVDDFDRGTHVIHVLDPPDGRKRPGRVGARRSAVFLRDKPDGRVGRIVLRQGIRYDSHVFVGFPTPVQR